MSKTKKDGIPHYELLYLIPNQYTEEELKPLISKVNGFIEKNGGKLTLSEKWGVKRLAYKIKNFTHGYYILTEFYLEGAKLTEVDRALRMMSEILRHQIVSKRVKTAEEIEKEKKISAKIAAKTIEEKKEGEKKEEENKKTTDKGKLNLGDLDQKLDKILETDDLL